MLINIPRAPETGGGDGGAAPAEATPAPAEASAAPAEDTQAPEVKSLQGTAPAPKEEAEDGGAPEETWYSGLPDTIRDNPNIAKYHSAGLEALALGHINSVALHGVPTDQLAKVPDLKDRDGTREYLSRLGAVDTLDDFTLENTRDSEGNEFGAGYDVDGPLASTFKEACFEQGLPPALVQPIYDKCNTALKALGEQGEVQKQQTNDENVRHLKETLGPAFDDTFRQADYVANELGIMDALIDANIGTDPRIVNALAKLAPIYAESSGLGKLPVGMGGTQSRAELKARAADLEREAMDLPTNDGRKRRLLEEALKLREQAQ